MNAERFQEIAKKGGLLRLAGRACFRLTGADRVRYLNGQVTQDVRLANDQETHYACVTDVKGRVVGDVFIHASSADSALYLDAEPSLRGVLAPRLERYIISDDVELVDVTDEWELWHLFGPEVDSFNRVDGSALRSQRLGCAGVDLWVRKGEPDPDLGVPVLTEEEGEVLRVLRAVPKFPNELGSETFPPEAGLDARAISYTKGCYIGQEILSRIRTSGKMPRRLVSWESDGAQDEFAVGDLLFVEGEGGGAKKVGEVTSLAFHPTLERWVGLAYLKSSVWPVDSGLLVGGCEPRIGRQVKISSLVNQ